MNVLTVGLLVTATACGRGGDEPPKTHDNPKPQTVTFCNQVVAVDAPRVHCSDPAVKDLVELSALRSLREINLSGTSVESLLQLRDVGQVTILVLSETPIRDLANLDPAQWRSLQRLDLRHTKVADLGPLAVLPALRSLSIADSPVEDLGPVIRIPTLQELNASATLIKRIPDLTGAPALETLHVNTTDIVDLEAAAGAPKLRTIALRNTIVQDILPLADAPKLEAVDASSTMISASSVEELRRRRPDVAIDIAHPWTGTRDELREEIIQLRASRADQ